jgi:hypothetical protein
MMQLIILTTIIFCSRRESKAKVSYFIALHKNKCLRFGSKNAICHRHVGGMFIVINKQRRCAKKIIQRKTKQTRIEGQDEAILTHTHDVMTTTE